MAGKGPGMPRWFLRYNSPFHLGIMEQDININQMS